MSAEMNTDLAIRYISGKLIEDEKRLFETWLCESPLNKSYFDEFRKYWEISGKAFENYNSDVIKGWKIVKPKTTDKDKKPPQVKSVIRQAIRIAASVLILLSIGLTVKWVYNWWQKEDFEIYASGNNILSLTLTDGTKVWLNENGEIKIPKVFKGSKRNVFLIGEAYFEVTKNPKRPFKIYSRNAITEVLGTSFNLSARESDSLIKLNLITGKVAFYLDKEENKKLILLPGQTAIFNTKQKVLCKSLNRNMNFLSWKTKELQFKDASLPEICEILTAFYKVKIISGNLSDDSKYRFTGNFNNASMKEVFSIIELTLGLKFVRYDKIYKIEK
jgi:transmembrane sensor